MSSETKTKNVFVAGHNGMVGSALLRALEKKGGINLISRSRNELNLLSQKDVNDFFKSTQIDEVYLAAAKVGGIHANNKYPADFIYENLVIASNIIYASHLANVNKLLFLGSSCIYPKHADQPMDESALLTGLLEETNEPYAISKIAGIKLCESFNRQYGRDYRSVMPTNLYGPNDNFHKENSHVIPALIRRFHEAKVDSVPEVKIWGTGTPKREFLHVDDMAEASIHVMNIGVEQYKKNTSPMLSHINVGSGEDCSILELANKISKVVGFQGSISFDHSKPDGTPRKLMSVERINSLGWKNSITLEDGLKDTYVWFQTNIEKFRGY